MEMARDVGFEPTRPFDHRLSRRFPNEGNDANSFISVLKPKSNVFTCSNFDARLSEFLPFCMIDLQLSEKTAKQHRASIKTFLEWLGKRELTQIALREYLSLFIGKSPNTYANHLKSLKVFCRDYLRKPKLVETFKFPQIPFEPKTIPKTRELRRFYTALESQKDKALFLLYASSGLRRNEALQLLNQRLGFSHFHD